MGIIGVDIGGTKCAVVSYVDGEIKEKVKFPTEVEKGVEHTLGKIYEAIDSLLANDAALRQDLAFGISCGGPLDSKTGMIYSPPNLPGWDGIPITKLLSDQFGAPAFLMNDANACALAEWHFGAAKGYQNVIFLTFGTGMGAGLILNGRLYAGTNDLAGEVGHIRLAEDGPWGYGKFGSFEGFCSGGGIARMARQMVIRAWDEGKEVSFCRSWQELDRLDTRKVAEAAKQGDELAREIMLTSARYLGKGLAILIDILNPEIIVIGSVYARCEELMRPTVLEIIQEEALPPAAAKCQIVPAGLGEKLGDYAAISVALYGLGIRLE